MSNESLVSSVQGSRKYYANRRSCADALEEPCLDSPAPGAVLALLGCWAALCPPQVDWRDRTGAERTRT